MVCSGNCKDIMKLGLVEDKLKGADGLQCQFIELELYFVGVREPMAVLNRE